MACSRRILARHVPLFARGGLHGLSWGSGLAIALDERLAPKSMQGDDGTSADLLCRHNKRSFSSDSLCLPCTAESVYRELASPHPYATRFQAEAHAL